MDLHEIFREGWQWASEQVISFSCRSRTYLPDGGTHKTCLGGSMHCASASSWMLMQYVQTPKTELSCLVF